MLLLSGTKGAFRLRTVELLRKYLIVFLGPLKELSTKYGLESFVKLTLSTEWPRRTRRISRKFALTTDGESMWQLGTTRTAKSARWRNYTVNWRCNIKLLVISGLIGPVFSLDAIGHFYESFEDQRTRKAKGSLQNAMNVSFLRLKQCMVPKTAQQLIGNWRNRL